MCIILCAMTIERIRASAREPGTEGSSQLEKPICSFSCNLPLCHLQSNPGASWCARPRLLFHPQPLAEAEPLDLDADEVSTCLEALCSVRGLLLRSLSQSSSWSCVACRLEIAMSSMSDYAGEVVATHTYIRLSSKASSSECMTHWTTARELREGAPPSARQE